MAKIAPTISTLTRIALRALAPSGLAVDHLQVEPVDDGPADGLEVRVRLLGIAVDVEVDEQGAVLDIGQHTGVHAIHQLIVPCIDRGPPADVRVKLRRERARAAAS